MISGAHNNSKSDRKNHKTILGRNYAEATRCAQQTINVDTDVRTYFNKWAIVNPDGGRTLNFQKYKNLLSDLLVKVRENRSENYIGETLDADKLHNDQINALELRDLIDMYGPLLGSHEDVPPGAEGGGGTTVYLNGKMIAKYMDGIDEKVTSIDGLARASFPFNENYNATWSEIRRQFVAKL